MSLRAWLAEKPWDGNAGRQAALAVERGEAGELFTALRVFDDGKVVCGFTYDHIPSNLAAADHWAAFQGAPVDPLARKRPEPMGFVSLSEFDGLEGATGCLCCSGTLQAPSGNPCPLCLPDQAL